jgi:hypothetical protein
MIVSYRDAETERFANGERVKECPVSHGRPKTGSTDLKPPRA